ncbi:MULTISPECIES: hypothetical protein [Pseudomonas]|uniref:hypothetical protein n=1 Tax=Pseudomonas TaxID=286 RepID=UPI0001E97551|nr:hypothetical protein [Pseudomonas sp. FP597]EFQ61665.1 hypothetical protein PFWH6_4620 [Pseudomonas fluorescens WH6]OPA85485.1 hypothetical protein BFW86_22275 [Pseudomonas fluorescens]WLI05450.1 hypothetical protein PSH66_23060 [Pseudomonas sp. FP597]
MAIGAMAALPVVGDLLKTALPVVGDIVKAVTPLIQPFADAVAKKIGTEEETQPSKSIEFAKDAKIEKLMITFKQ